MADLLIAIGCIVTCALYAAFGIAALWILKLVWGAL